MESIANSFVGPGPNGDFFFADDGREEYEGKEGLVRFLDVYEGQPTDKAI